MKPCIVSGIFGKRWRGRNSCGETQDMKLHPSLFFEELILEIIVKSSLNNVDHIDTVKEDACYDSIEEFKP